MSVWPRPLSSLHGNDVVWASPNISYTYEEITLDAGKSSQLFGELSKIGIEDTKVPVKLEGISSLADKTKFISKAFEHAKKTLLQRRFIPWKMHPRGHDFEPALDLKDTHVVESVAIKDAGLQAESSGIAPEGYRLVLSSNGRCEVYVTHVLGAIAALSTFVQLFYGHSKDESKVYCASAPAVIQDGPRFSHRGMNLDISRNVIHPADIRRTLDGLWLSKLNRLHIHATDSQSWPLMIPSLPELAEKGAYHPSQIWHPSDLESVQSYGRDRGVEVYLEIDLPGHTGSIWHSHPELVVAYNKLPWDKYAVEPPSGQLKLNSTDVHTFISKVLEDVGARVKPFTSHFHIGGDELNTTCYELEAGIESGDRAVLEPFLARFFTVVFDTLARHNLRPILWEDILLDYPGLKFPKDAIFQVWRQQASLAKILAKGHCAIVGPSDHWYLDVGLGGFTDPADPENPGSPLVRYPYPDWNPPYKNWRMVYSYNPFAGLPDELLPTTTSTTTNSGTTSGTTTGGTTSDVSGKSQKGKILGGEVSCWCELTDTISLDGMLWPRAAAAAEVLWSGPGNPVSEQVTRRLAEMRERLVLAGIAAGVVQMEWSLRNRGRGAL